MTASHAALAEETGQLIRLLVEFGVGQAALGGPDGDGAGTKARLFCEQVGQKLSPEQVGIAGERMGHRCKIRPKPSWAVTRSPNRAQSS